MVSSPFTTCREAVFRLTSLRLDGESRLLPRVEPAVERVHVLPAPLKQLERHTGARPFVRSSAVGDDRAVARDLAEVLLQLTRRDADRPRQLRLGLAPRLRVARVHEDELLAPLHALFNLFDRDPGGFHRR